MCGIIANVGHSKQTIKNIFTGLSRLTYRGYDSCGIAFINKGQLEIFKTIGGVDELEEMLNSNDYSKVDIAIGHTRWATHGEPSQLNSHPHSSQDGSVVIVHNGIIENYSALKKMLEQKSFIFKTETDTEVMANLISFLQKDQGGHITAVVKNAMNHIVGACAFVVISESEPDKLVAVTRGSPLILGKATFGYFIASDESAFINLAEEKREMKDGEIITLTSTTCEIESVEGEIVDPKFELITRTLEEIEKGNFPHFMLKEIYEQPETIARALKGRSGRVNRSENKLILGGIKSVAKLLKKAEQFVFLACGTSYNVGLLGKILFQNFTKTQTCVEYASEFILNEPSFIKNTIPIAISQSGETRDTITASKKAKEISGGTLLGICNAVGRQLSKLTNAGSYLHVGPEIGVASTKAFTGQFTVLFLWALKIAQYKNLLTDEDLQKYLNELVKIPEKIKTVLENNDQIMKVVELLKNSKNCLFLGRGINFPLAMEGALKLKEVSYIHAEAISLGEMKHGSIALIDENMPVIVIATKSDHYDKTISNIEEIKARKGKIIAIVTQGDCEITKRADYVIEVPETEELLSPLLSVIPLQLIAYHTAVALGYDPDKPRNLAKSVTVE